MFDISDVDFVPIGDTGEESPIWTLRCRNDNDEIIGSTKIKQRIQK